MERRNLGATLWSALMGAITGCLGGGLIAMALTLILPIDWQIASPKIWGPLALGGAMLGIVWGNLMYEEGYKAHLIKHLLDEQQEAKTRGRISDLEQENRDLRRQLPEAQDSA